VVAAQAVSITESAHSGIVSFREFIKLLLIRLDDGRLLCLGLLFDSARLGLGLRGSVST
jgi:hypothetical protein